MDPPVHEPRGVEGHWSVDRPFDSRGFMWVWNETDWIANADGLGRLSAFFCGAMDAVDRVDGMSRGRDGD